MENTTAFWACRAITSEPFFSVFQGVDPIVFIAIPLLLLVVTVLATWAPARHDARVDPLTSLRHE
jgi:ABC-type lipoprotein release transport system permease subunit